MKQILSILLCLSLLAFVIFPAFAQRYSREEGTPGYVKSITKTSDGYVVRGPTEVYAVSIQMPDNSSTALAYLYDDASIASTSAKIQIGQTTAHGTKREIFDPPMYFENDVYVDVSNAYVTVEYR